jgi:CopG family nickel-responsive transcriptional regulator
VAKLVRFGVTMEEDLLARFDALVARRGTPANRSEALRDLVRDALVESKWQAASDSAGEIVGTITMLFDHQAHDLCEKLDAVQHEHHDKVISAMHVHLDRHHCLEVMVVRGSSGQVRNIADLLLGTKGVKHGKLVVTTTGQDL